MAVSGGGRVQHLLSEVEGEHTEIDTNGCRR